jgi:hypothetical protein
VPDNSPVLAEDSPLAMVDRLGFQPDFLKHYFNFIEIINWFSTVFQPSLLI